MFLQWLSPRKTADSMIMVEYGRAAIGISQMHGQKLLTLSWCSFLGHSSDVVATIFGEKGGR